MRKRERFYLVGKITSSNSRRKQMSVLVSGQEINKTATVSLAPPEKIRPMLQARALCCLPCTYYIREVGTGNVAQLVGSVLA